MESYPLDDNEQGQSNRQIGNAVGLAPDEVELWVTALVEDGSGMGYVVHFSKHTPTEVLAKVAGLGAGRTLNIGPID